MLATHVRSSTILGVFVAFLSFGAARALAPGEQTYSTALHLHGSSSEQSGSVEWHASKAQAAGVDVLWWTDHDWRIEAWQHTKEFTFESASVNGAQSSVFEPDDAYPPELRQWNRYGQPGVGYHVAIVDSLAAQGTKSWRFSAEELLRTPPWRAVYFLQTGSRTQNKYSLARRIRLRFSVFPEALDPVDGKFVLEVKLSEHPTIWHTLRYVLGSMEAEGVHSTALPYQLGVWNQFEVDVTADAIQHFTSGGADTLRGEDNSLFEIKLGFELRNGSEGLVFVDDYHILSDETFDGAEILQKNRDFGALYESMYSGVAHFSGSEISRWRAQPHMNAYAPNHVLVDYTGYNSADTLYYAIDQVHDQGGAVSLAHAFGTGIYSNGFTIEPPEVLAARILATKRALLAARAYRADLLEVGYRVRGGAPLVEFLATWDALAGNAIFLVGNGVTDSHGTTLLDGWGPWQPGNPHRENNFVTWLMAKSLSEAGLVEAMLAGRAFFGDPYLFDENGELDLVTSEGFRMGRVVLTDQTSHDLVVEVEGIPPSADVRLLQGEIRENSPEEYIAIHFLRDEILAGTFEGDAFTDTVTIDTTIPSFVRVEVSEGTPWVYSNPIVFVRDVPEDGISPHRLAASLGGVSVLGGEKLRLFGASFTEDPSSLVLTGDEETPGLGLLTIDPGALGAPSLVSGASSWSYEAPILTVSGFSGEGSVIEILWGAVGTPVTPSRVLELDLRLASPNPFSQRATAEIALPDPAVALLEVLDVAGRRVRILLDERLPAGLHRVGWDGLDPFGRPVADGVYFVRLRALGRTLTTKAVLIR